MKEEFEGGDDTVIEKLYSQVQSTELIGYFWSGKFHKTIKGINLITLYYRDIYGNSVPINDRLDDKKEGKTKNDYFREMVEEVLNWGLKPRLVTGDSWDSGIENLKFLRNQKLGFLFGIEKNRTVSDEPGMHRQVGSLEIPEQVCGIGRFQVRDGSAIKTHIFCVLQAFVRLEILRSERLISNWYEVQKHLFTAVIREYIVENLTPFCQSYS